MSEIQARDLSYTYGDGHRALDGLSLIVEPGEVVGLLGRNGAGKTTLMHCLLGLLKPSHGSVELYGLDPRADPIAVKSQLGHVSEHDLLPPGRSVSELLEFHADVFPDWDQALCDQLVERFGIKLGSKIRQLSKGQVRQVSLVCAVAHRPRLLLLDEPAGGLDPAARREVLQIAIEQLVEGGTTVLFSSHHMTDVERLAHRVVLMDKGQVLLDDDLDRLREGCSLVVLPSEHGDTLRALPSCLRVRDGDGDVHGVLAAAPSEADALVAEALGGTSVRSRSLNLEDLFVELVG
ncbi:MAG: ABC-2 type transport system ATP-binding protein [Pseudohongiellaceae bacterium]|jgi:ABC-2 type transport system ATP-binding protein